MSFSPRCYSEYLTKCRQPAFPIPQFPKGQDTSYQHTSFLLYPTRLSMICARHPAHRNVLNTGRPRNLSGRPHPVKGCQSPEKFMSSEKNQTGRPYPLSGLPQEFCYRSLPEPQTFFADASPILQASVPCDPIYRRLVQNTRALFRMQEGS